MISLPVGLNELLGHIHIISVSFPFIRKSCLCCLLEKDRRRSFKRKNLEEHELEKEGELKAKGKVLITLVHMAADNFKI